MCYKYINIHIKCNVSSICYILNLSSGRIGAIILLSEKNCGIPYSFLPSLHK
jgi:hypothetical protein